MALIRIPNVGRIRVMSRRDAVSHGAVTPRDPVSDVEAHGVLGPGRFVCPNPEHTRDAHESAVQLQPESPFLYQLHHSFPQINAVGHNGLQHRSCGTYLE